MNMLHKNKIKDLNDLVDIVNELRSQGKKVAHSHGVFDLLHLGHIRHFEQAKSLADILVVTVTPDEYVNKGPHRPAFTHEIRTEALAALEMVDYVSVNRWPLAVDTIEMLKPDFYVKGPDYNIVESDITGGIASEIDAINSVGGKFSVTEGITFSSSTLLNQHFSNFSAEVQEYLNDFRSRFSIDEVLSWMDRISTICPMVVGEAIVDEYVFSSGIGKSTKDPVLAVLQEGIETYAGGSLAVANHLAGLCDEVILVTQLGDVRSIEDFIRKSLQDNVKPYLLTKSQSSTIHKRRIVDRYTGNKLLEIYDMSDHVTRGSDAQSLLDNLQTLLVDNELVIVADYGHGMLTKESISLLCDKAKFLAMNVQSNAGNRGFNPVSKYKNADYVCLQEHEVQVETRQREGDVRAQLIEVMQRIDCPRFTVTRGSSGSIHYDESSGFVEAPAFAVRVLDRVGAGDAVFAITSLLVQLGAPWEIIALIGNVAGAQMVSELGNSQPLNRITLSKSITSLMK
ncbi:MAG TPA: cytidyltransferase [Chloroflexi bacterium]|nr:cytidyltransferase [Chloroflexota bacterium]